MDWEAYDSMTKCRRCEEKITRRDPERAKRCWACQEEWRREYQRRYYRKRKYLIYSYLFQHLHVHFQQVNNTDIDREQRNRRNQVWIHE